MSSFKDNFSKQSAVYSKYRPNYPDKLFEFLSEQTEEHELVWDCGTGNGQSALSLTNHYRRVIATDPSSAQIGNAVQHEGIEYRVEQAESSSLHNHSADLVTVSQALHWFDFEKFYTEVKRVLKPGGVYAAWCYGLPSVCKEMDPVLFDFHNNIVGDFWQRENRMIEAEYESIPFPFDHVKTVHFEMDKTLSFQDLTGLLYTWSAVQRYIAKLGHDPVELMLPKLSAAWGSEVELRTFTWKISLKICRDKPTN